MENADDLKDQRRLDLKEIDKLKNFQDKLDENPKEAGEKKPWE